MLGVEVGLGNSWPFGTPRMGDQRGKGDLLLIVTRVLPRMFPVFASFLRSQVVPLLLSPRPSKRAEICQSGIKTFY